MKVVMNSKQREIIKRIESKVKMTLEHEGSGHDWWHSYRVWRLAQRIAKAEKGADGFTIELAALLHDIADWKDHGGDESVGPKTAREILSKESVPSETIDHVANIIGTMSFKGAGVVSRMQTIEGRIVQDADRLDAIGAIGIARTFAYGGNKGKLIYDPNHPPVKHGTKESYLKNNTTSINHFYEKLLLLKGFLNTKTAKKMAIHRHRYMQEFLKEFYAEWEGKR